MLAFLTGLAVLLVLIGMLIPQLAQSIVTFSSNYESYAKTLINMLQESRLGKIIGVEKFDTLTQNALSCIQSYVFGKRRGDHQRRGKLRQAHPVHGHLADRGALSAADEKDRAPGGAAADPRAPAAGRLRFADGLFASLRHHLHELHRQSILDSPIRRLRQRRTHAGCAGCSTWVSGPWSWR